MAALAFQIVTNLITALLETHGAYGSPIVSGSVSFMFFVSGENDPIRYAFDVVITAACLYPAARAGAWSLALGTAGASIVFVALIAAIGGDPTAVTRAASWLLSMLVSFMPALNWRRLRL